MLKVDCLTYLFLWRLWASETEDRAYLPEKSDLAEVFTPRVISLPRVWLRANFPFWNPHVYAGYPQNGFTFVVGLALEGQVSLKAYAPPFLRFSAV